jgi:predicted DNA-binding helix-hairpin-helix protein
MNIIDKLQILSQDAQYDLACACSNKKDDRRQRAGAGKWLYPVSLPNGGKSIIFKTLLSNTCTNDCGYCPLRSNANAKRCSLSPDETAKIFMDYLRAEKLHGLFLSSGVIGTPDRTMEKINAVARILRIKYKYKGFIHLKVIPGASTAAIEDSISLANAISLNIETAGEKHFRKLSHSKNYLEDIIRPIKLISEMTAKGGKFSKVNSTTQFIVGASDETDSEIIKYMAGLYDRLNFNRIYFSAYQQGQGNPNIPGEQRSLFDPDDSLIREHRLYQTDFLLRKYGFKGNELVFDQNGNLDLSIDPKEAWALAHSCFYPVKINYADKEALLRVPGLGLISVNRILKYRKIHYLRSLTDIGIKGKLCDKAEKYSVC